MKDVPKFVRQRLAEPASGDHPEANLLAAFAEGGLTMREREQVLSHLGKCAACRATLAVAMPAITAGHPSAGAPLGMRWLRWPMLRWAGVGAAVVVVAAAVVIQSSRRPQEDQRPNLAVSAMKAEQAKESPKSAVGNDSVPVLAERASRKEAATDRAVRAKAEGGTDKKKDAADSRFARSTPAPMAANKIAESGAPLQSQAVQIYDRAESAKVQHPVPAAPPAAVTGVLATEPKQQATAPAAPVPSVNESVEISAASGAVRMRKSKAQDRGESDLDRTDRAHGSAGNARPTTAADSGAIFGGPLMKAAISIPSHWRLSSEGALERSTDAGRTWQLVRVDSTPATLRSFSVADGDIWAGGTGGALYHSADNGRTWARVTVKAGDVVLESEIVRVEFTDARHGTLTTVAAGTWTTSDAGLTWLVRR